MQVFLVFFKLGAFVYGSGYVLLAFLQTELVENLKWISARQLLDAVAIGQITPGPLFTTATFIGYIVSGVPGAIAATIGIFLPAFIFSSFVAANWERLTRSPRTRLFLDAVNAASVTLMLMVAAELGRVALHDAGWVYALLAFSIALLLLIKTRLNSMWLMLSGALAGYLIHLL
jgi:chromate transporter